MLSENGIVIKHFSVKTQLSREHSGALPAPAGRGPSPGPLLLCRSEGGERSQGWRCGRAWGPRRPRWGRCADSTDKASPLRTELPAQDL